MADRRPKSEKPVGSGNPNRVNRLLTAQVKKDYADLTNLIMVSNLGLNSEQTTTLRKECKDKSIRLKVVRSRLSVQAFREMGVEEAEQLFEGATAIIDGEDPVVAAKVAVEFVKKFEKKMKIVGGLVEGKILTAKEVLSLAQSKSKPELLAEIVMLSKSPGGQIASQLKGPGGRIAGAIKSLVEKLEKGGEGEAADKPAEAAAG